MHQIDFNHIEWQIPPSPEAVIEHAQVFEPLFLHPRLGAIIPRNLALARRAPTLALSGVLSCTWCT